MRETPLVHLTVGHILDGRYRIDGFLAAGGMGEVYRGTQLSVDRPVAIKVIGTDRTTDHAALQRFSREARAISALQHPNIVNLIDFGDDAGTIYLVMELVEGVALTERMRTGSNPRLAVDVLRQVASGLAEAHAAGLVHRDLKPDNLLVGRLASGQEQLKIVDFGIAKVFQGETVSKTGAIVGTPHYMSPEQAMDRPLDGRSDLFALGIVGYEMLTGRRPFDGAEPLQVMLKICQLPHPPLAEIDGVPSELGALIDQMLAKAPEDRPQSAIEIAASLAQLDLEDSGESAPAEPSALARTDTMQGTMEVTTLVREPTPDEESSPQAGGHGRKAVFTTVLGVLAVAIAGIVVAPRGPRPNTGVPAVSSPSSKPMDEAAAVPSTAVDDGQSVPSVDEDEDGREDAAETEPSSPRTVQIATTPTGAEVSTVEGVVVGTTPVDVRLPDDGTLSLEVRLAGYQPRQLALGDDTSSRLVLHLVPERRSPPSKRPPSAVEHTRSEKPSDDETPTSESWSRQYVPAESDFPHFD